MNEAKLTMKIMTRSFDPDIGLPNQELPNWCRFPEPVRFDLQDEAGCQDGGKGSSGLMDRYIVRCVTQLIAPLHKSYHLLSIVDFKTLFRRKGLDVMAQIPFSGLDDDGMPLDPTDEQMQTFATHRSNTIEEAWHRFRGERTIGRFALQAIAFGYTPESSIM